MRFLQQSHWLESPIHVEQQSLEYLSHSALTRFPGAETHLFAHGTLQCPAGKVELVIEGGKGADTWDRRLELHYDDGVIVMGFGTLKHPPYLWYQRDGDTDLTTFDVHNSGYTMHFGDILAQLGLPTANPPLISCEQSEQLMQRAMLLLNDIYQGCGSTPARREQSLQPVDAHQPKYLTDHERQLRQQLSRMLDTLAKRA